MEIFARASLMTDARGSRRDVPVVLLEGSRPGTTSVTAGNAAPIWSLDETLDATHGWIDDQAIRLASQLTTESQRPRPRHAARSGEPPRHTRMRRSLLRGLRRLMGRVPAAVAAPSPVYVHERKLRYYLAKLLRVAAFFNHPPQGLDIARREVRAHLVSGRDDDYAALLSVLASRHRWQLDINWHDAEPRRAPSATTQPKRALFARRLAGKVHRWTVSRSGAAGPRLVLCGNAAGLDPLCQQLLARHSRVAWLYDEFCVRTWRRWRRDGVHQLLCCSEGAARQPGIAAWMPPAVELDGIDLAPALAPWLRITAEAWSGRAEWMAARIAAQFGRFRPAMLIVDEDQTPLPRIAVAVARQMGIPTAVVQHGVPRVAFGFAPLESDWFLAWGETSRRQLETFGYPAERIAITGSPRHDCLALAPRWFPEDANGARREVLLFATTPPDDCRPEPLRFRLTSAEHDRLLRIACQEVAALGRPLVVKTHPRAPGHAAALAKVLGAFPQLDYRVVTSGSLAEMCRNAACGISLASGAGMDAAALGVPVVELAPRGGADLMPAAEWGIWAAASDAASLRAFFDQAGLNGGPLQEPPHALVRNVSRVFANWGHAAGATADAIVSLALGERPGGPHGLHIPRPRFASQGEGYVPSSMDRTLQQRCPGSPHPPMRTAQRGPQTP